MMREYHVQFDEKVCPYSPEGITLKVCSIFSGLPTPIVLLAVPSIQYHYLIMANLKF
jgi:hypothetical protein